MTYRTGAPKVDDAEILPIGPAKRCIACRTERTLFSTGETSPSSMLPAPRACSPRSRVLVGFFSRCSVDGEHLHESCKNCGHEWLSRFGGGAP